ncbi:LacI family DNA-binding transcriptional regulator [Demequina capsici]|uniref:LacI family DNA-binding transcriptional regulator n=1 Tax=Demequina capsici TaxID=3075620 RepID=A0AA96F676_9MICO|nr:LacI family DNA-binding transcriptional regulator [Demequina sp. OYTSA14]WNM23552.1 LacI family DNA-binding transcriptional regulator [Demequina sp. OYTSA14]
MAEHRHVTLAAVAKAAGVAKSTASHVFTGKRVVAPETAERVRHAAAAMGYTGPSALGRALASGRTQLIAVVTHALLEDPDTDPLSLAILDGLQREFAQAGYGTVLIPPITDDASRDLAHAVLYDGVVSVRRMVGFEETNPYLESRHVPWIALDGYMTEEAAVVMDDAKATEELARRVLEAGHERIAIAGYTFSVEELPDGLTTFDELYEAAPTNVRRRLDGFVRAGVEPVAVFRCGTVARSSGEAAARALLEMEEPPTCILTTADVHAAGIIDYARRVGLRIPEDLSVTGFDAVTLGGLGGIELCTVVQDGMQKGRIVARRLLRMLEAEREGRGGLELGDPEELPLPVRWGDSVAVLTR